VAGGRARSLEPPREASFPTKTYKAKPADPNRARVLPKVKIGRDGQDRVVVDVSSPRNHRARSLLPPGLPESVPSAGGNIPGGKTHPVGEGVATTTV